MDKSVLTSAMETLSPEMIIDSNNKTCEICGGEKDSLLFGGVLYWHCHNRDCMDKIWDIEKAQEEKERIIKAEQDRIKERQDFIDDSSSVMAEIGVPKKYQHSTLDSFVGGDKYIQSIKAYLENPTQSLYIYGSCGSGKTHLSTAIIRELCLKDKYIWHARRAIYFKPVSDLLFDIRNSFNNKQAPTEEEIVDKCLRKDYLILDDIGTEKISEFSISTLYIIINTRLSNEKVTIVTSNLSRSQFEKQIDNRIASRFAEYKAIHLDMPDYRKLAK